MWVTAAFRHSLVRPTQFSRFWKFHTRCQMEIVKLCLTETRVQNCNDLSRSHKTHVFFDMYVMIHTWSCTQPTAEQKMRPVWLMFFYCRCCQKYIVKTEEGFFWTCFLQLRIFSKYFANYAVFCIVSVQKPFKAFGVLTDTIETGIFPLFGFAPLLPEVLPEPQQRTSIKFKLLQHKYAFMPTRVG